MSDVNGHPSRFEGIVAKLKRAEKHISDLKTCWLNAREADPGSIIREHDSETGQVTYYVDHLTPIPIDFPLIAGDAIQNMRSALDHLVCGMVRGIPVNKQHAFPIVETATEYNDPRGRVPRQVKGVPQTAIDLIGTLKPYKGGNPGLWTLHTLNNIDKHRLLLTVGIRAVGHTILPATERALLAIARWHNPGADRNPRWKGGIFGIGPSGGDPILKKGDVLLAVPVAEDREEMKFAIDVAFAETGLSNGVGVYRTLLLIHKDVSSICDSFRQYL